MAAQGLWSSALVGERDAFGKRRSVFLEATRLRTRSVSRHGRLSVRTSAKEDEVSTVNTPSGGFLGRLSKSLRRNPQLNDSLSGSLAQDVFTLGRTGMGTENEDRVEGPPSLSRRLQQRGASCGSSALSQRQGRPVNS
eukprot:1194578-Prorocentrum_minimum.AAC.3